MSHARPPDHPTDDSERRPVLCSNCGTELVTDQLWRRGEAFFCDETCRQQWEDEQLIERLRWMFLAAGAGDVGSEGGGGAGDRP